VIARYLDEVHVLDKAGAYAIQESGSLIISHMEGSLSGVVGFPLRSFFSCCVDRGWCRAIWN
jgi:septum formation protein